MNVNYRLRNMYNFDMLFQMSEYPSYSTRSRFRLARCFGMIYVQYHNLEDMNLPCAWEENLHAVHYRRPEAKPAPEYLNNDLTILN